MAFMKTFQFLTLTFLATFVHGHTMWKFSWLGVPSGIWMELALHIGAMGLSAPVSLWNIYRGFHNRTLRHYSWWEGTRPLVSPSLFFAMTSVWVLWSPTSILETQPRIMFIMIGTLFANIAVSTLSDTIACPFF